jgi:hypothetical protein
LGIYEYELTREYTENKRDGVVRNIYN